MNLISNLSISIENLVAMSVRRPMTGMMKKMESFKETLVSDNDLTTSQLSAIKTIQKIARQKKALRTALAEHQWKIFADFG